MDWVDTVYVSPLRALGTDITRNLVGPLGEMAAMEGGVCPAEIRVGQRTGDTTAKERAGMVKRPPHILVTTPESLALCLASGGMRQHLKGVRRIIIDELHSLGAGEAGGGFDVVGGAARGFCDEKRGGDPQRIGLSATIAPLERMAEYLIGDLDGNWGGSVRLRMRGLGGRWSWRLLRFSERRRL